MRNSAGGTHGQHGAMAEELPTSSLRQLSAQCTSAAKASPNHGAGSSCTGYNEQHLRNVCQVNRNSFPTLKPPMQILQLLHVVDTKACVWSSSLLSGMPLSSKTHTSRTHIVAAD